MNLLKKMGLGAMLCASTLLPQAFAQQEVDPTWYDPWATAPVAAHVTPSKAENQKNVRKKSEPAPELIKAKKIVRRPDAATMHAQVVLPK